MKFEVKKENRNRKADKNWEQIFEDKNILDIINRDSLFYITANEIKKYREPRLMTKFDSWISLPYIFQKHKLNILPVQRGRYVIGKFNAYKKLNIDKEEKPLKVEFPHWIKTLNPTNLSSEAKVLNCAYVIGILDRVMEADNEVKPTISGRMSTETWDFYIKGIEENGDYCINNDRSQCQIDGGYESLSKFAIIEAKNSLSNTFIVRQLYYPYRLWYELTEGNKKIEPIFLVYSNSIFYFLKYRFGDPINYSSIEFVEQKAFKIAEKKIKIQDIINLMEEVKRYGFVKEPPLPFPQANSFDRVMDLLEAIRNNPMDPEEISLNYDFAYRQGQYYSRAGMYLGLLEDKIGIIQLTPEGEKVLKKRAREKYLSVTKKIIQHKVFFETLFIYLEKGKPPTRQEVYKKVMAPNRNIIYSTRGDNLGNNTLARRASTVKAWVEWILDLTRRV